MSDIIKDLKALGVKPDDTILVHSSFKATGEGSPQALLEKLLKAVSEGTLMLPSLTYINVNEKSNVFNAAETKSCVGLVPEIFRTEFSPMRSLHPTHSFCAIGKNADELLQNHYKDNTPCGENSPVRKLRNMNGKILMLGCSLAPNTSMHGVEELTQPDYLFLPNKINYTVTDTAGKSFTKAYRQHNFAKVHTIYERIEAFPNVYKKGMVGSAVCYLINANELWKTANACLQANPRFFVQPL